MMRVWLSALTLSTALTMAAQKEPVFRADASVATVSFHVVRDKFYVDDLSAQDVVMLEDGIPRNITFFESRRSRRTTAVDVALLFDTSGSVVDEHLLDITAWKSAFLTSLPTASLAVYGFNSQLFRFCPPSRDSQQLQAAFNSLLKPDAGDAKPLPVAIPLSLPPKRKAEPNKGATWIYESVIGAINDMATWPSQSTRLIVIFSDGFGTTTSVPEDAAKVAGDAGVAVYPVVLGHSRLAQKIQELQSGSTGKPNDNSQIYIGRLQMQEREIAEYARLGELTGGRSFDPPVMNTATLQSIINTMVGSVLTEYVIGFTPQASDHTTKHQLTVKLVSKESGRVIGGTRTIVH